MRCRSFFRFATLTAGGVGVMVAAGLPDAALASTFETIYTSDAASAGPNEPDIAPNGDLYITTFGDQTNDFGSVIKLLPPQSGTAPWTKTTLFSFANLGGNSPGGGVIMGPAGNLYGTTEYAGNQGTGTIFALVTPPTGTTGWHEVPLYTFPGNTKRGALPGYSLLRAKDGALYGVTGYGGSASNGKPGSGGGTAFKLSPPPAGQHAWSQQVLFSFGVEDQKSGTYPSGGLPNGALVMDAAGALYGTTEFGGVKGESNCQDSGCGVVFRLNPPAAGKTAWTETVLHAFTGGPDGGDPVGRLVLDASGAVYGAANFGGLHHDEGVIFKLSPPAAGGTAWPISILHTFTGANDGRYPSSGLVMDRAGTLYGTAGYGGIEVGYECAMADLGCGVAFKLTPPVAGQTAWTETVLHLFTGGADGNWPGGDLTMDASGALYGITGGGGTKGYGTIFKIVP